MTFEMHSSDCKDQASGKAIRKKRGMILLRVLSSWSVCICDQTSNLRQRKKSRYSQKYGEDFEESSPLLTKEGMLRREARAR